MKEPWPTLCACLSLKCLQWHRDFCNESDIRMTVPDNKPGIDIISKSTSNLHAEISNFSVHILKWLPDTWTVF